MHSIMIRPAYLALTVHVALGSCSQIVTPNDSATSNLTGAPDLFDSHFSVTPDFGPNFLSSVPTLMAVLGFMATIAHGNYEGTIEPIVWTMPDYPQIRITTEERAKTRFLLQGVLAGIEYMIQNNRFQEAEWTLIWENLPVGVIQISNSPRRLKIPGADGLRLPEVSINLPIRNNSATHARMGEHSRLINGTGFLNAENIEVEVATLSDGSTLDRFHVFLVCYSSLIRFAHLDVRAPVKEFVGRNRLSNAILHMYEQGPGVSNFRAMQMIVDLPRSMLQSEQGFREVAFYMEIDQVRVLEGSIITSSVHGFERAKRRQAGRL